jgi:hypothetical protein
MRSRTRRATAALAAALAGAVVVAGCGNGGHRYENKPRPASKILISGSINTRNIAISPYRFGAGPIDLLVTNQTGAPQRVTLESLDQDKPGLEQQTAPINPRDTARLSVDVTPGTYRVAVEGDGIRAARLVVGSARRSAQNDLLQP